MITSPSVWGAFNDLANNDVLNLVNAGAPTDGTAGTGAGLAGPGSTCYDTTNGVMYRNYGTKLAPIWSFKGIQYARAVYDFAVDGGAIGLITPARTITLPDKAIILGGVIDHATAFTSLGSATISVGTSAGSSAASLKAATAVASFTGLLAIVPVFTAATMVKMTAAGAITLTVAVAALTAGKAGINVAYMQGL